MSEWPLSGLTPVQSKTVKPPRVGESGFSMECELGALLTLYTVQATHAADVQHLPAEHHYHLYNDAGARTGTVVLGRVRLFHAREDLVDPETFIVDTGKLMPVSRLGGITYARTTRAYELPVRPPLSSTGCGYGNLSKREADSLRPLTGVQRPVYAAEKEKDEVKKAQAKV